MALERDPWVTRPSGKPSSITRSSRRLRILRLCDQGGTFSLVKQDVEAINGAFSCGSITLVSDALGCGIQVFNVVGILTDVTTPATTGGTGEFSVTLTHFRALYVGRCTTFFAKVSGTVTFSL